MKSVYLYRQKRSWSLTKWAVFLFALGLSISAEAQSDKRDYVWFGGFFGNNYLFDFNNGSSPQDIKNVIPISFLGNNASICDREGNLLYYTNGCHVVGRDHQILPNGSGLNDGDWITQFRGDTCSFYPTTQDILILPDPGNEDNHYIIHKPIELGDPRFKSLRYSYIESINSMGRITDKGIEIIPDIVSNFSYLTACPHLNNEDWWIVDIDESELIYSILLSAQGFETIQTTKLPTNFVENSSGSGTTKFSPDGNTFAFYNAYDDLHLYDFERATGEFSNHRYLIIEEFPDDVARFSSVEWSPNSRFIYVSIEDQLWQIDTWEDELEDGLELIDTWDGTIDPFPTTFFLMHLAPDCKIYMCSTNGVNSLHVINNPNEKGTGCDFVQRGIKLPHDNGIDMPNFPRFRVDEEDKCDPTITSIFGDDIWWRRDLTTYPNPVRDLLTIELPEQKNGKLIVLDMDGRIVMTREVFSHTQELLLSMTGLPSGTYSVEFLPEQNKERRIWTSRVVKVE